MPPWPRRRGGPPRGSGARPTRPRTSSSSSSRRAAKSNRIWGGVRNTPWRNRKHARGGKPAKSQGRQRAHMTPL
eukprot:15484298-Alexandrium_andersonii.AAC.1